MRLLLASMPAMPSLPVPVKSPAMTAWKFAQRPLVPSIAMAALLTWPAPSPG